LHCDPNPASAYIDVIADLEDGERQIVYLMDMTGRLMASHVMSDNRARIDVGHLPDGMYIAVLTDGRQVQVRKIVVHH
jgi:hypothetical protein